jgi:hypothetical protein
MTFQDFLERYGVTLGVVSLLAIVLAVLPGNAPSQTVSQTSSTGTTESGAAGSVAGAVGTVAAGGNASGNAGGSVAGGQAGGGPGSFGVAGGGVGKATVVFGKGDCRPDRREAGISVYSPPCVSFSGPNGGATSRGVFSNKIVVVRWIGQSDPATQAILQANKLADDEQTRVRTYNAVRLYANQHYITYGREVVLKVRNAGGPSDNDQAMRADAIKIANDDKAFAVIEGSPDSGIPKVMAQELAHRGVVCICTVSLTGQFYKENPPYIFGAGLPTADDYAIHIGEFIGKRLAGRKAQWAGDELYPPQAYKTKIRKFGLLILEGAKGVIDPEGPRAEKRIKQELARWGVTLCSQCSQAYTYDPGANQEAMSTIVSKFKAQGVTTLIHFVDPLSPILITKEMTRQQYFPENFISGSGLSDTTTAGRLYDPGQWSHAFGISPLWITWQTVSKSGAYRIVHHGDPRIPNGQEGVLHAIYVAEVLPVFTGIQMAGPILTPDSFARGMFNYPPTGGKPAAPLVFYTRESPTAIKDFSEVWFDATRSGNDERGESGTGMMIRPDDGKRYRPGQWPRTNPKAFVRDGHDAAVSDNPALSGDQPHEQDGHHHVGACKTCPGFKTVK